MRHSRLLTCFLLWVSTVLMLAAADANKAKPAWQEPKLPGGKTVATDRSAVFITPPAFLAPQPADGGYTVAKTAPTVDFMFFPGQTYAGRPWSAWGNGGVYQGKYYTAIGDHAWDAFVFEYDPATKKMRTLVELKKFLDLPEGHYTPGKVHSFITPGKDGWLYYATHNGGGGRATAEHHYKGDWILRSHPETGKTEVVSHGPAGAASIPVGFLDPERMIFYGGTEQELVFFAFDVQQRKLLYRSPEKQGPTRNMLFSQSTGRVYYRARSRKKPRPPMRRYDPATNQVAEVETDLDPRCSSSETPQGLIYAIGWDGNLWSFNVKTEASKLIGFAPIAKQKYTTTLPVDPSGRYLYYCSGAHGGAKKEGTPIVQFDTKTLKKKVIAFLTPFYPDNYKYACDGTYSLCLSADGSMLFATWNGARNHVKRYADVCAMTAIQIPESERLP